MASGPDLFVVCKKCGSEVSPYITECPYCGTRLRKRAPKLERGGVPKEPKAARRRRPTLGRLKPGEIPGIRGDRRPYATISLVLASILVSLAVRIHPAWLLDLELLAGTTDEYYRTVTTLFVYNSTGYELVALGSIFLFGWLLERRHGAWVTLLVFFASGVGGMFLAIAGDDVLVASGGNGAALGLLAAWAVRGLRERDEDRDLLGAAVVACLLLALPLATVEAHWFAGVAGGAAGLLIGLVLARLREA